jgi:hypothetical protein
MSGYERILFGAIKYKFFLFHNILYTSLLSFSDYDSWFPVTEPWRKYKRRLVVLFSYA